MRITCPLCGERDRREFYYKGSDEYLRRPSAGAELEAWDAYLHLRDNTAGTVKDLWQHEAGCSAWIIVERSTVTHAILSTVLASEIVKGGN